VRVDTLPRVLARIPPFTSPRARLAFLRVRGRLGRSRRRLFERLGSARYSRPALFEMDRKLEEYVPFEGGVFVEAGANDGFNQSNTYFLERFRGWTGVLVEPIPELYRVCVTERPRSRVFQCALVPPGYPEQRISMRYGGLMSLVAGAQESEEAEEAHARAGSQFDWDRYYEVEVPVRTLSSVLDEAGVSEIDLLSLDVEGFEPEALAGLDLERHAPKFLLVEMLDRERTRARIEELLGPAYELAGELSPYDVLYRRKPQTIPAPKRGFAGPETSS
jgi:FkbM family methyltransferase